MHNIEALRTIDQAISGSLDLSITIFRHPREVTSQLKVDAADVLLFNLQPNAGICRQGAASRRMPPTYPLCDWARGYPDARLLNDVHTHPRPARKKDRFSTLNVLFG